MLACHARGNIQWLCWLANTEVVRTFLMEALDDSPNTACSSLCNIGFMLASLQAMYAQCSERWRQQFLPLGTVCVLSLQRG